MNRLNVYKTDPTVTLPAFATQGSACFDLAYQPGNRNEYSGFNMYNGPFTRPINENGSIMIMPGDRVLVPTGYIFDIPAGYSVRLHARSGLSLKRGLVLANAEAVIDSDYVEETMVMLTNVSETAASIEWGDRIAQAEMIKSEEYILWEVYEAPALKGDRNGGLGSTGVSLDIEHKADVEKRGRGRPRKEPLQHHSV